MGRRTKFLSELYKKLEPAQTDPVVNTKVTVKMQLLIDYVKENYPEDDYLNMMLDCIFDAIDIEEIEEFIQLEKLYEFVEGFELNIEFDEDDEDDDD